VLLPPTYKHKLLKDSKLLTPAQREKMDKLIRKRALAFAIQEISAADINRFGLGWANVEIFRRLVTMIEADGYCCDGRLQIDAERKVHSLVKGDQLVPAISAASIIAKVYRDNLMKDLHESAPIYCWASNKGYGAKVHRDAIKLHGPHSEHRNIFIASLMQLDLYEALPRP
jgi:ribonuclease HII